jgi:prepilin-type N-terminal cleavage/methylation domain-containing protein
MFVVMKNKAFTLAEVLITLGIIGVVAALTLPGLIAKQRKQALHAGLKKAYSEIEQMRLNYQNDEGTTLGSDNYVNNSFRTVMMKYFRVAMDCGLYDRYINQGVCYSPENTKRYGLAEKYKSLDGSVQRGSFDDGQIVLEDGMVILLENPNGRLWISVDVNGHNNPPNTWGEDLFTFQVMEDGRILPMGAEGTSYTSDALYCSKTSTVTLNGISCTDNALYDPDFWR